MVEIRTYVCYNGLKSMLVGEPPMNHFSTSTIPQVKLRADAIELLFRHKWPNGFVCPRCSHNRCYVIRTRRLPLFQCRSCRHQTSLIVGTVMEASRTSLDKWIIALRLISRTGRKGTTAVELSKTINVTYKTAWSMLHKLRQAMISADQKSPLIGNIKAGISFYCRPYYSLSFRIPTRSPVIVAAQVDDLMNPIHLKLKQVPASLMISTRLSSLGEKYFCNQHVHPHSPTPTIAKLFQFVKSPKVKSSFEHARTWINITFFGIGPKFLQAYLDEYCFRYNCLLREESIEETLLQSCVKTRRIPLSIYNPLTEHFQTKLQESA